MKRCPQCGRDYNDDSLSFCLDDGRELLFGPSSTDEPATEVLRSKTLENESETRVYPSDGKSTFEKTSATAGRRLWLVGFAGLAVLIAVAVLGYRYVGGLPNSGQVS